MLPRRSRPPPRRPPRQGFRTTAPLRQANDRRRARPRRRRRHRRPVARHRAAAGRLRGRRRREEPGVGRLRRRDHPARQRAARAGRARAGGAVRRRGAPDATATRPCSPTARRCSPTTTGRRSSPGLPPGNGITRTRLHKILQDAVLGSGADVRTGVTFTALEDTGEHVDVGSRDGESARLRPRRRRRRPPLADPRDASSATSPAEVHRAGLLALQPAADRGASTRSGSSSARPARAGFVPLAPDLMYMLTIEKPPEGEPIRLPHEGLAAKLPRAARRSSAARSPSTAT